MRRRRSPRDVVDPGDRHLRGPPRDYIVIVRQTRKEGGVEEITLKPGPKNPFKKETVERRVADGSLTDGFIFQYQILTVGGLRGDLRRGRQTSSTWAT